jgi:hypothetical protein
MSEVNQVPNGFTRGTPVLIVLQNPREKCWGLLDEITTAGVFLRGLDLNAFDEWIHAIVHDEATVGLGSLFFPMWRVEKIAKDETLAGIPSLALQVEQRTGRKLEDIVQDQESPFV